MKTLCLMRHAKSGWDLPMVADHDRPLARRGVEAAPRVGRHLKERGIRPDLVLCSTAKRATETLRLVLAELGTRPPVETERGLYLCGAAALLDRLRKVPDSVKTLLAVGHNPDMHELAIALAGAGDAGTRRELRAKFPTGGCAVLAFDVGHWRDVASGNGHLIEFVRPRELA